MTNDVSEAVQRLQKCSCNYFYSSLYWTERTDRAIDTILRNPNRSGHPSHLVRNALSDSRKIVHRRRQICSLIEIEIKTCEGDDFGHNIELVPDPRNKELEEVFIVQDWLERASLSSQDRLVLTLLLKGSEAKEVAEKLGITVQQARVRISRARNVLRLAGRLIQMFDHLQRRLYRLSPWLIRALIPVGYMGTYELFRLGQTEPIYVGRSDTCLRNRLLRHAQTNRADYFDYDIHWTLEKCFIAECSAYHALLYKTNNLIHPAQPQGLNLRCPFCRSTFDQIRQNRLSYFENVSF